MVGLKNSQDLPHWANGPGVEKQGPVSDRSTSGVGIQELEYLKSNRNTARLIIPLASGLKSMIYSSNFCLYNFL